MKSKWAPPSFTFTFLSAVPDGTHPLHTCFVSLRAPAARLPPGPPHQLAASQPCSSRAMEQQPSRRRRGRGSEDEGTTGREQGPSVVDPRRRPPEGSTWGAPWPAPVFMVTVDLQGFFHVAPHAGRGPFRSVGEALLATETMLSRRKVPISSSSSPDDDDDDRRRRALYYWWPGDQDPGRLAYYGWWAGWPTQRALNLHGPMAWIYTRKVALRPRPERPRLSPWSRWEYHIELRNGLFFAHPPYVGGPFHSLGEAAAAIKCHLACASATQQLMKGYYFILKNGLFHVRPDGAGGPFKQLDDAMNAVACHRGWIQLRKERIRRRKQFIDEIDPAVLVPRMKELVEMIKNCKRDGQCPKPEKRREEKRCDPAISEEADRFERIVAEKQLIENGMKWMENEVLQAFETYKESSRYQGSEYEFVKLDMQCLIHDSSSKSYHHYNFTMRKKSYSYIRKKKEKMSWDYQLFFAEVKPTKEGKKIICCPLQSDENGPCFGCQNVGIDLRHPTSGCYEKGEEKSGFPYDRSSGSDY